MTPASTAMRCASASSALTPVIRQRLRMTPPSADAPPAYPVPAPRGVTATPCAAQTATTPETSSVDAGNTTASARRRIPEAPYAS